MNEGIKNVDYKEMMKSYDLNLWDSIFPFQIDPNGKFTNLL
jgi:hypothetical protein